MQPISVPMFAFLMAVPSTGSEPFSVANQGLTRLSSVFFERKTFQHLIKETGKNYHKGFALFTFLTGNLDGSRDYMLEKK